MESGAKRAWVYFNNDYDAHATRNARSIHRLLPRSGRKRSSGGPHRETKESATFVK